MISDLIEKQGKTKFLTAKGQRFLLENEPNAKYKFMWMLLGDGGLRVTEARNLRWSDLEFGKRQILVKTLKQKGGNKGKVRIVPMTERVMEMAGLYWKSLKTRPEKNDLVFPSPLNREKPISRQQIDRNLKDVIPGISAHTLRHTFGAKLASEGTSVETTAKLLGHNGTATTFQFYYHLPEKVLRSAVERTEPKNWGIELWRRFFPKRRVHIQPMAEGLTKFHVGRKKEMLELATLCEKKVNTLILGPQGIGKSHLLDNLQMPNILRADEVGSAKKFIGGILLMLHEGMEDEDGCQIDPKTHVIELVTRNADVRRYIIKESLGNLVETLLQVCKPKEYTIMIDDVTRLTQGGLKVLEKLKGHFHIVAAGRTVKLDKISGFTNFQRIDLRPLSRSESHEFAELAATRLAGRIENFDHFKDYLYRQTKGIPGYMLELIERLDVETDLSIERVNTIEHIAARRGVAIFPFIIIGLACMTAFRYIGKGIGIEKNFLMTLAGIGMLALFFGREVLRHTKRKNI